jgi:hypothetical protein
LRQRLPSKAKGFAQEKNRAGSRYHEMKKENPKAVA